MAKEFSACEVIEMAVQIEKNGRDFYSAVYDMVKKKDIKNTFLILMEEEIKHIEIFEKIFSSSCDISPDAAYPDEYFAYLNAIAGAHVLFKKNEGKKIAKTIDNAKDAISLAIQFEKDSILFYLEMKQVVPKKDQHLIDELIIEEKKHLRCLTSLK
ncbi:rubrerythrin [Candidatus Omnitrophus magneticus]|uniref:Rubrerythrin n=1 Tax=Candidatus Omnitrophus magneticus TaxID=1609969 RepID=A0A0F0CQ26_9BACT|nr:rubrerythrin [Candidatus Omnitrophus magneticus]